MGAHINLTAAIEEAPPSGPVANQRAASFFFSSPTYKFVVATGRHYARIAMAGRTLQRRT
jgi:hypothetical protein